MRKFALRTAFAMVAPGDGANVLSYPKRPAHVVVTPADRPM